MTLGFLRVCSTLLNCMLDDPEVGRSKLPEIHTTNCSDLASAAFGNRFAACMPKPGPGISRCQLPSAVNYCTVHAGLGAASDGHVSDVTRVCCIADAAAYYLWKFYCPPLFDQTESLPSFYMIVVSMPLQFDTDESEH